MSFVEAIKKATFLAPDEELYVVSESRDGTADLLKNSRVIAPTRNEKDHTTFLQMIGQALAIFRRFDDGGKEETLDEALKNGHVIGWEVADGGDADNHIPEGDFTQGELF